MGSKLNIKRDYLLLAGVVIMLWVCYQFAFKRTAAAWQLNRQLKQDFGQQTNLSYQPGYLERKNRNLDKIIEKYKVDSVAFRTKLIEEVSLLAEKQNARLVDLPADDATSHSPKYIIQRLDLEGAYSDLLKLTNTIEHRAQLGILRSAMIKKPRRPNSETQNALTLTVYIEMVK